jgi:isochorismate synthase
MSIPVADPSAAATLRAHTRPVAGEIDLVAVAGETGPLWVRHGHGFAGRGVALRIEVTPGDPAAAARAVQAALASIAVDPDAPGPGPVALGGLPFDPRLPGWLVVPQTLVGRGDDGRAWVTRIEAAAPGSGHEGDASGPVAADELMQPEDPASAPGAAQPTRYQVTSPRSPEEWCQAVADARDELRSGVARKVVLARELVIEADRPLSRRAVLEQLRRAYPAAMLFAADGFVGASPELLVERTGQTVRSHPMAGTAPRSGHPTADAALAAGLLESTKDQIEHRFTIDMVHDTLLPWCSYLDEEAAPSIVAMANVQHLATLVEGQLSSPPASVIELMRALHPTPAVNGSPRQVALDLIERYDGFDRARYGGPVGWVDADGNGAWTVGIRSAEMDGPRARLFAGVGVVADSDPADELAETRAKFEAMLNAILRP